MKLRLLLVGFVAMVFLSSCIETCIECEIYDEYGHYVKDYGEYCSEDYHDLDAYEIDADDHAWEFYGGHADCSRN